MDFVVWFVWVTNYTKTTDSIFVISEQKTKKNKNKHNVEYCRDEVAVRRPVARHSWSCRWLRAIHNTRPISLLPLCPLPRPDTLLKVNHQEPSAKWINVTSRGPARRPIITFEKDYNAIFTSQLIYLMFNFFFHITQNSLLILAIEKTLVSRGP